jgi:Fe-S cluster assembly iron-binding protein IscA
LKVSTLRGITIDFSEELENAWDSIRFNLESDSIEIDESDLQLEKQDELRISMVRGITIDFSEELENASDSIRFNLESDSIEIDERDLQPEKQPEPRISTPLGTRMQGLRPRDRIRTVRSKFSTKSNVTSRCSLPSSIQIETFSPRENAEPSRFSTVRGITIDFSEELENAADSIPFNLDSDSIETDEKDPQQKKQHKPRISTYLGTRMQGLRPRDRIRTALSKLITKSNSTTKCSLPSSIQIENFSQLENAEPLIVSTVREITIDFSEEHENVLDSIHFNLESNSIEIDESDLQTEKQLEARISTPLGTRIQELRPRD